MFMSAKKVSPNADNDYDVPDIFKISNDMMKVTGNRNQPIFIETSEDIKTAVNF